MGGREGCIKYMGQKGGASKGIKRNKGQKNVMSCYIVIVIIHIFLLPHLVAGFK